MGLFRPYEQAETNKPAPRVKLIRTSTKAKEHSNLEDQTSSAQETVSAAQPQHKQKKSVPTPTRKAAEAARMNRLHPQMSKKEARRRARITNYEQREIAQEKIEKSPARMLLRNYIDARWTFTEFLMPLLIVFLALTMLSHWLTNIYFIFAISITLWIFLLSCITNIIWLWYRFTRELSVRLPQASRRGLFLYLINRASTIRRFRRPAPVIRRGEDY